MSQANQGDKVRIHYTGKLEDGTVFGSSVGQEPLEFTIGLGNVIPGVETAIVGMAVGDKKTVTLPPAEAYGERSNDLIAQFRKSDLPNDLEAKVGDRLQMRRSDGQNIVVTVTSVGDDDITIDANPPLAGRTLIFELELVEIAA
jgi:FKBP-type peptidyl-prolyl cis-trans isomerase 2